MKTSFYILTIILSFGMIGNSCSKEEETAPQVGGNDTLSSVELTQGEKDCLLQMREEEKLARDVYLYAGDLYGMQIFSNISASEQRHMDEVLKLLDTYELDDPASQDIGKFNNAEIQNLYNDLTSKCDKSLLDALLVGATIEDLDLFDLETCMANSNKSDILQVYEHLSCGSRNHMRAFTKQIIKNGGSYSPLYITVKQYEDIVNSEQEKCEMN